MTDRSEGARQLGFEPGLDGIRGIAVLVVAAWHFGPDIRGSQFSWIPSGHVGVDLFFVLSGFLITVLMLGEQARSGRISFTGFYQRRVFRLLPALGLFLLGHLLFAVLVDVAPDPARLSPGISARDEIASVVAAAFFVLNWARFGDFTVVEGMVHLWSLSVEEQFYLVWPAVTALMLARGSIRPQVMSSSAALTVGLAGHFHVWDRLPPAQQWLVTIATGVIVAALLLRIEARSREVWNSCLLVALIGAVLLYRNGNYEGVLSTFDLYTNTLARADSLLVGALLAHLWASGRIPRRCPVPLSMLGWAIIIWSITQRSLIDPYFYRFGWTLIAVGAALAIWGAIDASETFYGRVLSFSWLRGIGKVAYGLYLWHVLVFAVVRHTLGDESVWVKSTVAIGATATIVALSWFVVEKPILDRRKRSVKPVVAGA